MLIELNGRRVKHTAEGELQIAFTREEIESGNVFAGLLLLLLLIDNKESVLANAGLLTMVIRGYEDGLGN